MGRSSQRTSGICCLMMATTEVNFDRNCQTSRNLQKLSILSNFFLGFLGEALEFFQRRSRQQLCCRVYMCEHLVRNVVFSRIHFQNIRLQIDKKYEKELLLKLSARKTIEKFCLLNGKLLCHTRDYFTKALYNSRNLGVTIF